jgi:hypothetical protein
MPAELRAKVGELLRNSYAVPALSHYVKYDQLLLFSESCADIDTDIWKLGSQATILHHLIISINTSTT